MLLQGEKRPAACTADPGEVGRKVAEEQPPVDRRMQTMRGRSKRIVQSRLTVILVSPPLTPNNNNDRKSSSNNKRLKHCTNLLSPKSILMYLMLITTITAAHSTIDGSYEDELAPDVNVQRLIPASSSSFGYNEEENREEKVAQLAQMAELMNAQASNLSSSQLAAGSGWPGMASLRSDYGDSMSYEESMALGSSLPEQAEQLFHPNATANTTTTNSSSSSTPDLAPGSGNRTAQVLERPQSSPEVPKSLSGQRQEQSNSNGDNVISAAENRNDHQLPGAVSDLQDSEEGKLAPQREALHSDPHQPALDMLHKQASEPKREFVDAATPEASTSPGVGPGERRKSTVDSSAGKPETASTKPQRPNATTTTNSELRTPKRVMAQARAQAMAQESLSGSFGAEILHDHNHESDKLHHHQRHQQPQPLPEAASLHAAQDNQVEQVKSGTQSSGGNGNKQPKLDLSGWIPSPTTTEAPPLPLLPPEHLMVTQQNLRDGKAKMQERERKQQNLANLPYRNTPNEPAVSEIKQSNPQIRLHPQQQQQQQQLEASSMLDNSVEELSELDPTEVHQLPAYFMSSPGNELSYQSSPLPKHVPPPFMESLEQESTGSLFQSGLTQQGTRSNQMLANNQLPSYQLTQTGSKLGDKQTSAFGVGDLPKPSTSFSSLKSKSLGLLPRLAAKLFNKQQEAAKGAEVDILNQQQSYQLPVHNAPQWKGIQGQTKKEVSATQPAKQQDGRKLFLPKSSSLVKSLFARDPLLRGHLLPRRPKFQISQESMSSGSSSSSSAALPASPPALPQSRLVLMNGQVYSVLSGPPTSSVATGQQQPRFVNQQSLRASAIFDHQTSDTSEFPVFEAMSMQHLNGGGVNVPLMTTLDSMPQVQQSGIRAPQQATTLRCDRPRHVIQADRSVVDHILQSQQNFVIARVPIRKYVRPPDTTTASAASPGHLYHAFPVNMVTSMSAPQSTPISATTGPTTTSVSAIPASQLLGSPFGPLATAYSITTSSRVPLYHQEPSIEVATIGRPSLWQSLSNFVSHLRPRRPVQELAIQTSGVGPGMPTSGSSPSTVYVRGPVILTTTKRRRGRRLDPQAKSGSTSKPEDRESRRKRLGRQARRLISSLANDGEEPKQQVHRLPGNLEDRMLFSAASNAGATTRSGEPADPMQRLLMLKTATDNEVCSPVSESGNKIKYSCLPNYCVAAALANVTTHYQSDSSNNGFMFSPNMYRPQQQQTGSTGRAPVLRPVSGSDADEKLQVQQFDDMPSPLVTYTHINAYDPPAFSKLAQPQHQQFVSTSQALEALANNEIEEAEGLTGERMPFQQHHQQIVYRPYQGSGDQQGLEPHVGQGLLYVQYPAQAQNSFNRQVQMSQQQQQQPRPTQSQRLVTNSGNARFVPTGPQANSVAFGTAYVTPTPQPGQRQQQQQVKRQTKRPNGKATSRPQVTSGDDESFGPNSDSDVNEFVAAVDDHLESPIRVQNKNKKHQKRRENSLASGGKKPKWQQQYQRLSHHGPQETGEQGGVSAENLLINSKQPSGGRRFLPASASIGYSGIGSANKQRRRVSESTPSSGAASESSVEEEPEYESSDYEHTEGEPDPPASLRPFRRRRPAKPKLRAQSPPTTTALSPAQGVTAPPELNPSTSTPQSPPINMTHPIPVLNGMPGYTAQAANPRERKMRRDNQHASSMSGGAGGQASGGGRFGSRQSTPLPPPEKSNEEPPLTDQDEPLLGPGTDLNGNPVTPSGAPLATTTDCDCNQTSKSGDADFTPTQWPDLDSHTGRLSGFKRNPTTLRPNDSRRLGSGHPTSSADLMLAKDRRQTQQQQQQHGSLGGLIQYCTKRPYNLRNTTYKNLQLQGNQNVANQLAPPAALSASNNNRPALQQQLLEGDISTTTALSVDENMDITWPPLVATTTELSPPGGHLVQGTYQEPSEMRQGGVTLVPVRMNELVEEAVGPERFHELFVDDLDDKLASDRTRNNQDPTGWRARLLAATNNHTTTDRPGNHFKPSSVNDILAEARRELRAKPPGDIAAANQQQQQQVVDLDRHQSAMGSTATSRVSPLPRKHRESEPAGSGQQHYRAQRGPNRGQSAATASAGAGEGNEDDDENDVTPHQYQIQLRWSNSSGSSTAPPPQLQLPSSPHLSRQARKLAAIDKMKEQVRDNLFEHREEEHWHDKEWLKAKRARDRNWIRAPQQLGSLVAPATIDYGPEAGQRETPIPHQLPNFPSHEAIVRHFAIPTPNFQQSARFVDWVQRPVDMDEEPGEPQVKPKSSNKGLSTAASTTVASTVVVGPRGEPRNNVVISSSIASPTTPAKTVGARLLTAL